MDVDYSNEFFDNKVISSIKIKDEKIKSTDINCLIEFTKKKIDSHNCCRNISTKNFSINIDAFFESMNFNSCLNRKISIDVGGNIKNCPSMNNSYGNITNTTLDSVLNEKFKSLWKVTKDQIQVCKDCEFIHICSDCRAFLYTRKIHEKPKNVIMPPILQHGIKIFICFLLLFISLQAFCQKKLTRKEKKTITYQLDSLSDEDQKYRMSILYGTMGKHKIDSMQHLPLEEKIKIYNFAATSPSLMSFRDSLYKLMEKTDRSNFESLKKIIRLYAYPTFYKKDRDVLLIIEHSILYHPTYLDTLKQFLAEKKISSLGYAIIYDRYLRLQGIKIRYGTRGKYNNFTTCEDCLNANKARKEIGIKKKLKCDCNP